MTMKFDQLKDATLPKIEEEILAFWEKNKIFEKTLEASKDKPEFVFYEGPPTANGKPGIHHVISRTIKDLMCRYKTMKGFRVDRKGGWDTHGLPVEIEVEKALGLDSKPKVLEYGVDKFNQKCKESVFKYISEWNEITRKIGYWLDLDNAYVTLTNDYIESVWWILKNYFDRDLIYQGYKTVPYCPRCETGLSSHEVAQGYLEVADPSVFVKAKAADGDFYYLVWTTTPWTLPSNAALCMRPEAEYALIEHSGEKLVLASSLLTKVIGDSDIDIIETKKGSEFEGRKYVPMFDTFADQKDKAFKVITADFVTMEDGTGIVHIAPGYGADDYEVGQKHGLPVLQAVEGNGHFAKGKYKGKFIKDADPDIIKDLKAEGKLYKKEAYIHNYPFCWRCDSPLIYISRHCWYIKTTRFKKQLIDNSNKTSWYPDEIRTGRMLDWLENNVDWALSRERFWGTPLPIWICEKCEHMTAVGSVEQLRKEGLDVPEELDLHKPTIDNIKLKCEKCGGTMNRIPEVIDTWFDSGSMPYAQWHYPFENEELFENKYPADFISEAVDQTRGWFYSLLAISTILFDKPAFKNVIVIEMILDAAGKKMSKHKGNVTDPFRIVYDYGADPLRWYMLNNSNPWLPTKFDEEGLKEVIRKLFDTLKNSYSFFALYTNIDNIAERANQETQTVEQFLAGKAGDPDRTDRWVISRYNSLIKKVTDRLENYDLTPPTRMITDFVINDLSNWYIRLNRRRFWAEGDDPSKMRAYYTLYVILKGVSEMIAPYCPFFSDYLWRQLTAPDTDGKPESVHMTTFPTADESLIDLSIEESMGLAEKIVSIGRAARSKQNLKVRQPLAGVLVNFPVKNGIDKISEEIALIKEELNVKEVAEVKELSEIVSFSAKLNFATAGKKLGAEVKEAAAYLKGQITQEEIAEFRKNSKLAIKLKSGEAVLEEEDLEIIKNEKEGYSVESGDGITVALQTEVNEDLRDEGFAREVVNKVQNMRKSSGFEVTDRINILIRTENPLTGAMERHNGFICRETLADKLDLVGSMPDGNGSKKWNINGVDAEIAVVKI